MASTVNFTGMFNTLVIRNQDVPAATVAAIDQGILSQLRVNVANMSLCRDQRGGDALMVIELDQHLKPSQVALSVRAAGRAVGVTYYDKEED